MDTKNRHEALYRACQIVGGQAALARILEVTPVTVNQWVHLQRPIPSERCPDIEEATSRQVMCEELLPSFRWDVLRKSVRTKKAKQESSVVAS